MPSVRPSPFDYLESLLWLRFENRSGRPIRGFCSPLSVGETSNKMLQDCLFSEYLDVLASLQRRMLEVADSHKVIFDAFYELTHQNPGYARMLQEMLQEGKQPSVSLIDLDIQHKHGREHCRWCRDEEAIHQFHRHSQAAKPVLL